MNLGRRHYDEIAQMIKRGDWGSAGGRASFARDMADFLGKNNGGFNRDKFLEKCGVS